MRHEIAKAEPSALQGKSEYDEQRELFRRFGLPVDGHVMSTTKVVKRKDGTYALVKRSESVDVEFTNDGMSPSFVARLQRTKAEQVLKGFEVNLRGLARDTQRAVMDNVLCSSVEPGETEAWS